MSLRPQRVSSDIVRVFAESVSRLEVHPTGHEIIATLASMLATSVAGDKAKPGEVVFKCMAQGFELTVKKTVES